jgi:hypothetical protein
MRLLRFFFFKVSLTAGPSFVYGRPPSLDIVVSAWLDSTISISSQVTRTSQSNPTSHINNTNTTDITTAIATHCNKKSIYVFPEKELCGFSPNIHIYVSVSDLYIPRIGPNIFLQQNRQNRGNK